MSTPTTEIVRLPYGQQTRRMRGDPRRRGERSGRIRGWNNPNRPQTPKGGTFGRALDALAAVVLPDAWAAKLRAKRGNQTKKEK